MDFIDFVQDRRRPDQDHEISRANRSAEKTAERTAELEEMVDRLVLACKAMWELLRDSAGLSESQFAEKVWEIDLRDGKLDGKSEAAPTTCPNCSRPNSARRQRCLYCATDLDTVSPLDAV